MPDPDWLFRRYRETRDPEWIAQVFDLVAPRLLRLAVHLVGRADEAEDLVQETFLAAIERADDFEASRELVPWLSGILARQARYARRRAAREPDPARLRERVARSPLEEAEAAELTGSLAKALDRLEEPTRQVLLLRLRHGLAPAEIAHLRGESPGAVRVRVHRGMEDLRRLLPSGFASAAFLLFDPARGLAAIRRAAIHQAQAAAAPGTTSLTLGGLLMTRKVVLVAAVLVAVGIVAASSVLWPAGGNDSRLDPRSIAAIADVLPAPTAQPSEVPPGGPAGATAPRAPVEAAPVPELAPLRGRVLDYFTALPVAGARRRAPSAGRADPGGARGGSL
ncbi:MAG: sigma-70 family RNA polymerase sigma factor [Planctomycetota bacterium]